MHQAMGGVLGQVRHSRFVLWGLVVLRIAIGWHFLYEGVTKLLDPNWTSAAFLADSRWILSGFFHWIVSKPALLELVDLLNMWGLTLIGLALILGCFTQLASFAGALLLLLYYIAYPPLIGMGSPMAEGSYLIVDKNLIELITLAVLTLIPTGEFLGLDGWLAKVRNRVRSSLPGFPVEEKAQLTSLAIERRHLIRTFAGVPILGGFAYQLGRKRDYDSFEERHFLDAAENVDAVTTATVKTFRFADLKDLKGQVPKARIGDLEISRLICGGNLIGGWAHARDLIYVSKLIKSYHSDQKVFETLQLAEQCGINTLLTNPQLCRVINKYWRTQAGKIQFISDCGYQGDIIKGIEVSVEAGAHACYVHGGFADSFVKNGQVDEIGKAVDHIRTFGVPAGIGGHRLETIKACVESGIEPDFWVKTLHHCNYWSARPNEDENDNIWCTDPEDVIEFMNQREEPWIAYKVLAAGAIHPEQGFRYAFENGADFICVGMYDFQVVEDANMALSVLDQKLDRSRPWRA